MKKLLISLLVFFSSFLLLNKIKAQTNEVIIYDYTSNKFQDLEDNYNILEDVIDYINEHNTHNFSVLISYKYDNGSTYLIVGVNQKVANSNTYLRDFQRFYVGLTNHLNTYYYSSPGVISTQNSYCYFDSGTSNCNTNTQLNLSNYTQSDLQTFYTNINSLLSSRQTNTNLSGGALSLTFNNSPYSPFYLNNQNKFITYVWSTHPIKIWRQNQDSVTNMPFSIQIDDVDNDIPLWNSSNPPTPYILTDYKTWYDLRPHAPVITFTSQNYISNNDVYKKDVTIDFGTIDNDNYAYMYLNTNDNIWHTLYLTENTSYTFSVYENCNIIAQVIDKNTQEVFTSASYLVNDIVSDLNINIVNISTRNEGDQEVLFYETYITYTSDQRSKYIYEYTTSNYIVNNEYQFMELSENENSINFRNYDNLTIIARIKDKITGDVLYTKTTEFNLMLNEPKISFTTINYRSIREGLLDDVFYNSYISSVVLNINYGLINNDKYAYMYKKDTDNNWTTLYLNGKIYSLELTQNTNIIARVIDKSTNEIIDQKTITIYQIENINSNSSFLGPLKSIFDNNQWRIIINKFTDIFNIFKQNRIYNYLIIVIITSIILLILKSMKQ